MGDEAEDIDLVVVGGGMGGLATAALAQTAGLRDGLAGGPHQARRLCRAISAGALHLRRRRDRADGPGPGEPIGDLLRADRPRFRRGPDARATGSTCPTAGSTSWPTPARVRGRLRRGFPGARRGRPASFWRLQAARRRPALSAAASASRGLPVAVGRRPRPRPAHPRARRAAGRRRRRPSRSSDVLRLLGLDGDVALPVADRHAAPGHGAGGAGDRPVRQRRGLPAGVPPRHEPAPRRDARPWSRGSAGGSPRWAATSGPRRWSIASRPAPTDGRGSSVETRRRHRLPTRQVAFNLPLDLAARLLERPLDGRARRVASGNPGRPGVPSPATWRSTARPSPTTPAVPPGPRSIRPADPRRQQRPDLALAARGPGLRPADVRVATLSTHTRPGRLGGPRRPPTYAAKKADYRDRLLAALGRALPGRPRRLRARRIRLAAELPPLYSADGRRRRRAAGLPTQQQLPGRRLRRPRARHSGSSATRSSPGQGTMAAVLSAIRVVERITGNPGRRPGRSRSGTTGTVESLANVLDISFAPLCLCGQSPDLGEFAMLDALVVAPHPDDAELGMGGTIVRLIGQGWKVGILDLTSGEPTPLGIPGTPCRGDGRGERRAGQPLAQEPGPAEPEPGADPGASPGARGRLPPGPAAAAVRPLLGGRPPRPHRRDQAGRGRPVLEQALQVRHPRRAVPPGADPLLLQRPPADRRAARASCSTSPTSSRPRSRPCAATARNSWTTSPRAGPA